MSLVRALSVIVAAVFFIQLVNAGVSRRDTESATGGNEALDNILGQINTFAESLRTQVSQFTESTNMSQLLSDFQNQLNQVSQNLQQQFSPSAPAT